VQAETLERRVADMPGARDYPRRIIADIDRLSFLAENILSFNRLERGGWRPIRSVLSVGEIVDDLRRELGRLTDRDFSIVGSGVDELSIHGDPDLVRLLFLNLAQNSCKYSEAERVEIEISSRDGIILYRDNGVGIPHGIRQRL
jgi:two-component system sensor histidine kinase SenX3